MSDKLARRLVVTGHDGNRRSRIVSDTVVKGDEVPGMPGFECSQIWGADAPMSYPDAGDKPRYSDFFPPVTGCRLIETYVPPQAVVENDTSRSGSAAGQMDAVMPGLADAMEAERPGMHRTATMDMIVVLEGRCVLQLDEGEVVLNTGDIVIESGTIHAWANPFDEPCRFLAAVIGARNELCDPQA